MFATDPTPRRLGLGLLLVVTGLCSTANLHAQDPASSSLYTNLQALPQDVSRDDLLDAMLDNLRGLGLPRFQGRGCLHCHVGDLERPRGEWDYASDDKPEKQIARRMMTMVRDINENHLAGLGGAEGTLRVTCYTCHAGRLDPTPLTDVLLASYEAGGVDSLLTEYESLRERYFGADAYDFRPDALSGIATTLAQRGAFDDALEVSARNETVYQDDPSTRTATLTLLVLRAVTDGGAEAAITEFRRLREVESPSALTPDILDVLGWGLYQEDQQPVAIELFEENRAAFPDVYFPLESLTDAKYSSGLIDLEEAIGFYEEYLERFPTHQRARNRVVNLRRGG